MKFSPAQTKAIYARGNSLLVSAAAGSGKTAVLVERIIQHVLSGGDISRMWVMTFTEAAAAEMRQKIETAVERRLEADPANTHLAEQVLMLPAARISTVHAACKYIIGQNFHLLGLDPAVTVGDDAQLSMLFDQLLDEYADELYADPDQKEMIDFFSGGKSDEKFTDALHLAYKFYEQQPFPVTCFQTEDNVFDCFKNDLLYQSIQNKVSEAMHQWKANLQEEQMKPLVATKMWIKLAEEMELLETIWNVLPSRDFDAIGNAVNEFKASTWTVKGKAYESFEDQLQVARLRRDYAVELIQSLQKNIFHKSHQRHREEIDLSNRMMTALFAAVEELDRRFAEAKRDKAVISFADLERLTLKLLVKSYDADTDTLVPGEIALAMRDQIDEIIVDEYQDTNRTQDLIFRALSREGKNVFMVGDVKQSIYRFRAACPELFLEKKEASAEVGESDLLIQPAYLNLNQNFRSHPQILDFANRIFRSAMSTRLGQIKYDTAEQLNTGGLYPAESKGAVELSVIIDEGEDELTLVEKEACLVAQQIRALHGQPYFDVKKQSVEKLKYSHMAVLCRMANHVASYFETALRRQGIDCINNNQDQQFLDLWEIKMLRSYLQVIHNPYRDIPLVTLMYSDFYCFTAKQLAQIRACGKYIPFYDAVQLRAEKDETCRRFLEEVEQLRRAAVGKRTDEILQMIFAKTHILDKIASYSDGTTRVKNMQLMLRYAMEYEKDTYKGLFSFLDYLDKMHRIKKILPGAKGGNDPEECVHILSIHKSKGLEYPVCFVVNLERDMKDKDTQKLVFHNDLGVAVKMREDGKFSEYPTLSYNFVKEMNRRESLSEEMRILYVALTRPKTHLCLVSAHQKTRLQKLLGEVAGYCGSQPAEFLATTPSFLKWVLYALRDQEGLMPLYNALEIPYAATKEECSFTTNIVEDVTVGNQHSSNVKVQPKDVELAKRLSLQAYPYLDQTRLPIKLSVSEVKGMREKDPDAVPLIPESFGRRQPTFLSGKVTGNVIGNAVHKFMQFADFKALMENNGVELEKKRLAAKAFLTEEELTMVDEALVANFVAQPLFAEMVGADTLEKEKRFFFTMPAKELFDHCTAEDEILLQGVLDCCYEKNGQMIIVDYKTDRLSSEQAFLERYSLQLELYRYGLYALTGKKAAKLYLYSFYLNRVIEIS